MCFTLGLWPIHISYGVSLCIAFVGFRFQIYVAVEKASAQIFLGHLESDNIAPTVSTNVRFILSATPFCSGVFLTVYSS